MMNERGNALLLTVARLHRWASRHADLPAPAAQLRLLSLMSDLGPSRIGDLAEADNSSQPTMTTQVQRLEALGLVSRESDARDARATLISMTPKGEEVLEQARVARRKAVQPLLDGLDEEQLKTIDATLKILDEALRSAREHGASPKI